MNILRGVSRFHGYGLYDADLRSRVMSRKLTHFLFASIVSLRLWSLKTLQMCFLIFSISFGVLSRAARPSSHISVLNSGANFGSRYKPTNSRRQKRPIVTSKSDFDVFLHHVLFWLNNTELFAWTIMFFSLSRMVT